MDTLSKKLLARSYGAYFNVLALVSEQAAAKTAFRTFCKIRNRRELPDQAKTLDKAKKEVLEISGHLVQTYHWPGSGDTVLLLHGWESNAYRWRNLLSFLRENDFDVYALDAPGHGNSSGTMLHAPLYAECAMAMIEKYHPRHVIGHSMGGMTAIYTQWLYDPPGVEKIVTIGAPSEFFEIMDSYQKILGLSNKLMKALDVFLHNKFGFYIRDFSTSRYASVLRQKALIIHDKFDPVTPYHASVRVHEAWKGSKMITTEGLGHSLHQDEVNQSIIDFLNS